MFVLTSMFVLTLTLKKKGFVLTLMFVFNVNFKKSFALTLMFAFNVKVENDFRVEVHGYS